MKRNCIILLLLGLFYFWGCQETELYKPAETSILIDSDMVEAFDDGVAFMMLLNSKDIDIIGLTTVTGNTWAQEALAYGIRIGELRGGQTLDYIAGSPYPLRQGRLDTFNDEIDADPGEDSSYRGAISYPEITDWRAFYEERYGGQPGIEPSNDDASEFIYRNVMSAPGEITILAIGPCTNIAKAVIRHPEMAANTKEIIYMGGAVDCPGNSTSYAEMNFLYDPEAAATCLRAPFPKQTLVSLDVCNTVIMDRQRFMMIYDSIRNERLKELFRNNYTFETFEESPSAALKVWDLISAVIAIDPGIVTDYMSVRLDVDDDPVSATYGKSFETQSPSRQIVRVPLKIDEEKMWSIVLDSVRDF